MLNYINTMSLETFKEGARSNVIDIKLNQKSGKLFFVCGDTTGAVSKTFADDEFKDPVISQVESSDTGEVFYLMHGRNECGTTRIARL